MADGPDPLGKRALYWMPVAPEAEVDDDPLGTTGTVHGGHPRTARHPRPAGRHALFSDATPADEREAGSDQVETDDPLPHRGRLRVACSRCGAVTRVGLVEFAILQFPVGAWLPRGTFDRWMTCPSCRRRAWTSVTVVR